MKKTCSLNKYAGKRICVALSGGRDSVALLHYLLHNAKEFSLRVTALTCEHGIRGEESLRDLQFVTELCKEWGVPLTVFRADVPARCKQSGRGMEEEARIFRYDCYQTVLKDGAVDFVATAHHKDDVSETVLFRLIRGTSPAGLAAITEWDRVIRPFLGTSRAQIDEYVAKHDLLYREDSTNGDLSYARNRLRKEALPLLEEIYNGAGEHLVRFASLSAEDDAYLQALAKAELKTGADVRFRIDLPKPIFSRACILAVKELGVRVDYTSSVVEETLRLCTLQSGRRMSLPCGVEAMREGDEIVLYRPRPPVLEEIPFSMGTIAFGDGFVEIGVGEREGALRVDLDRIPPECVLRTRRTGDQFRPFHGREKTLKAFLTDRKVSARISRGLPVLAKNSRVYAVFGVEIADEIKQTEQTERRGYLLYVPNERADAGEEK